MESVLETPTDGTAGALAGPGLIDALLGEQGDVTAVGRFAQFHVGATEPLMGGRYAALLPAGAPGPGQQYAFEVDLDHCSGCKACVAACHALNGLDDEEAWREVGLLVSRPAAPLVPPVLQHVTSACHHCLDPACLNACPVDAYEKDPVTGIVRHLDDQCFGCQYCTLACPYDAPKFQPSKGIVRKCDLCSGRLAAGEAPACVQGCPHGAIKVRLVDRAEALALAESGTFLPDSPDPSYTLPTTRYTTRRPWTGAVLAADHDRLESELNHAPLVAMLVLTQASAGAYAVDAALRWAGAPCPPGLSPVALVLGLTGLAASLLHLGRPLYAYRALIGVRHSWLSREVAAFGLFGPLAQAATASALVAPLARFAAPLAAAAAGAGLAGVAASVMVYHAVRRPFWRAPLGAPRFFGTAAVLGLAAAQAASAATGVGPTRGLALGLAAATAAKLLVEASVLAHLRDPRWSPLRQSALLLVGPLAGGSRWRVGLAVAAGLVAACLATRGPVGAVAGATAFGLSLAAEVAERVLFFRAVVRSKMPGGVA